MGLGCVGRWPDAGHPRAVHPLGVGPSALFTQSELAVVMAPSCGAPPRPQTVRVLPFTFAEADLAGTVDARRRRRPRLFTLLADRPGANETDLAAGLALKPRPTRMLRGACTGLGLLDKDGDRDRNSPPAAEFLVEGCPHWFGGFIRYSDVHGYQAWHLLQDTLRADRPTTWDPDTLPTPFATSAPAMLADWPPRERMPRSWPASHASPADETSQSIRARPQSRS